MTSPSHLHHFQPAQANGADALKISSQPHTTQNQLLEWARRAALRDREAAFLAWPMSWPAMMVRDMDSSYCAENGWSADAFGTGDRIANPIAQRWI